MHKKFNIPTATIKELRVKALSILPAATIEEIINQDEAELVSSHYALGAYLRNKLNLWHTEVFDAKDK